MQGLRGHATPYDSSYRTQKAVIELKILYKSLDRTIADGLDQISEYMDRCGVSEGHLVIFDRSENRSWDKKIFIRQIRVHSCNSR